MAAIHIEEMHSVRSPLFRASYELYRRVFPKDEQMPKRYFHEHLTEAGLGLSRPFNFHYLVASRGEKVVGFGCCTYMAIENVGFIDYLAVDSGETGQGVGTAVRARLVEALRQDARDAGYDELAAVLGEVQEESPWLHRLLEAGAGALDIDYYQPPLENHKNPVPLVLYVEPVADAFAELTAPQVGRILYALYRRLYRIPYPLQDPNFRHMLKQLAGREHVGWKRVVGQTHETLAAEGLAARSVPGFSLAGVRASARAAGRPLTGLTPLSAVAASRRPNGTSSAAAARTSVAGSRAHWTSPTAANASRRRAAPAMSSSAAADSRAAPSAGSLVSSVRRPADQSAAAVPAPAGATSKPPVGPTAIE